MAPSSKASRLKVLLAASEAEPYAKTGGLADVVGALHVELRRKGFDARVIVPLYRCVRKGFKLTPLGIEFPVPLGDRTLQARLFGHGPSAIFVECDEFFDRDGLYGTSAGEYADNAGRYVFFCKAVLEACARTGFIPDVFHCHDWHTALVPLYVRHLDRLRFPVSASLFTIHNLGYAGNYPAGAMALTGLGDEFFTPEGLEFYGRTNLLKGGIIGADAVSTVSETYAREILTPEQGFQLEGLLSSRSSVLHGILNGIDYAAWNPARDPHIGPVFKAGDMGGKPKNKARLAAACGFADPDAPLAGIVSRLSWQKGLDIFVDAADEILASGCNVVVLGTGEKDMHVRLAALADRFPGLLHVRLGFDEAFAHRVYAGADMLLIPSRYEPCGLTQMIAMRYGTVPVARATGGLVDTIEDYGHLKDTGTGFLFRDFAPSGLAGCVKRALCVYGQGAKWKALMSRCMKKDFSWEAPVGKYIALYRKLMEKPGA